MEHWELRAWFRFQFCLLKSVFILAYIDTPGVDAKLGIGPTKFAKLFPQLIEIEGRQGNVDQAPRLAQPIVRQVGVRHLTKTGNEIISSYIFYTSIGIGKDLTSGKGGIILICDAINEQPQ